MKGAVRRWMQKTGAFSAFRLANRHKALILTYHRFSKDGRDGSTSARAFAKQLEYLVAHYHIVTLSTLVSYLESRESLPPGLAAITIDDGYWDAFEIARPILERLKVPASLFVVTDFVDGTDWLWTDKVRYLTLETKAVRLEGEINHLPIDFVFTDRRSRMAAATRINSYLKTIPESRKQGSIATLSELLAVRLPEVPPAEFSAVTWQQAREMDHTGIEIASHTATHPVLTAVDAAQLRRELQGSKAKLERELDRSVDLFCYPNGDIDAPVWRATLQAGYRAAVSTQEGFNDKSSDLLALRRVHTEPEFGRFVQNTSGFEQAKNRLRYAVARTAS